MCGPVTGLHGQQSHRYDNEYGCMLCPSMLILSGLAWAGTAQGRGHGQDCFVQQATFPRWNVGGDNVQEMLLVALHYLGASSLNGSVLLKPSRVVHVRGAGGQNAHEMNTVGLLQYVIAIMSKVQFLVRHSSSSCLTTRPAEYLVTLSNAGSRLRCGYFAF